MEAKLDTTNNITLEEKLEVVNDVIMEEKRCVNQEAKKEVLFNTIPKVK